MVMRLKDFVLPRAQDIPEEDRRAALALAAGAPVPAHWGNPPAADKDIGRNAPIAVTGFGFQDMYMNAKFQHSANVHEFELIPGTTTPVAPAQTISYDNRQFAGQAHGQRVRVPTEEQANFPGANYL